MTSRDIEGTTLRGTDRKWSRQSSIFAILALSLLGWVALGSAFQHLLNS